MCVYIYIYILICISQKRNKTININKCIVEFIGGNENMPVPILGQIMAGSVCIAHFRSWPFKSNCAKSPLDKAWCGFRFPSYVLLINSTICFDQRTSPKDESKGRVQSILLFECCLACLKPLFVQSWGLESPTDFCAWKFSGPGSADTAPDKFAKVHRTSLQMPGPQNRAWVGFEAKGQCLVIICLVVYSVRFLMRCFPFSICINMYIYIYIYTHICIHRLMQIAI